MKSILVLQSCSHVQQQGWMGTCLASVRRWSSLHSCDYRFVGDEIFNLVPQWYRDKVGSRLPIATDYARLLLCQRALAEGYQQVMWFDADLLILDEALQISFEGTCAFGQEVWVQESERRLEARRNIHNAVCVFRHGCPVLPFLIHSVASLIRRVDPAHIAPQMVGPKLLQALQPLADFAVLPQVSALSPSVVADLIRGGGPALTLFLQRSPVTPQAVNVCASLIEPEQARAVIESLQKGGLSSGQHQ